MRGAVAAAAALTAVCAGCLAPDRMIREFDKSHDTISRGLANVVDAADRAFGEARVEDREEIVRARIGLKTEVREHGESTLRVPAHFRLPLPALKRRANVFLQFDADPESSIKLDNIEAALKKKETNSVLAAIIITHIFERTDTGVKLETHWNDGPQFGIQPFARWEYRPEPFMFLAEQRVYYKTDNGAGGKSIANIDYTLGERSFLRFANSAEYYEELEGVNYEHALIYRRPFTEKVALSAEVGAAWNPYDGDPAEALPGGEEDGDEAYGQIRLIGKLWRPWIEWEIRPAYHYVWNREAPYELGCTFTLTLVYESYLRGPREGAPALPVMPEAGPAAAPAPPATLPEPPGATPVLPAPAPPAPVPAPATPAPE